MAQYDGSIRIDTQLNTRGFERGSRNLISGMERVGRSLNGIISSLGFALGIAGLVALGKQAIETASDMQEVQNVVDTAFGSMSYKMEEFAKTSVKQFGLSQLAAKEMGSTFMAMASNMVGSAETASDMAINLTKRAADMASFYNKSAEDTATALHGVFTGETEVLKQYGIVQTEVNLQEYAAAHGINKKISAMSQAEKVQLRYNYVMEQTSLAAGDFARTSDSWANQTRILSEQFKELLSVFGSGLITVLTPVVKFLNTVLSMLIAIAKQIGAILSKLFGIKIPTADSGKFASDLSAAAGGADDLANGMDAAGSAAKKAGKEASKALAPFDKLNVLSKDSGGSGSSGSGSGGGAGGGGFEMPELSMKEDAESAEVFSSALDGVLNRLKQLKDLFVGGFFEGLGDYKPRLEDLKNDIISIGKTLKEIFTDSEVISAANRYFNQLSYSLGQIAGSIASIGLTIAQNLVGGMEKYLTQNKDRIKQYIISMLDISAETWFIRGNLFSALADIFSVFGSETAQQITGNLIGIFAEVAMMINENAAKLVRDILNMIATPIIENKDKIKEAIEGTLEAIEPLTSGLLTAVQKVRDAISDIYDNHLKPLFDSIASGLSEIFGKLLDGYNTYIVPVLQGLGDKFKEMMEGPFGEAIDKISSFIGKLIDYIKLIWEGTLVPFFSWLADNIMPILAPIIQFIGETVINKISTIIKVIGDIAEVLGGIIDFISGVFTGNWEQAWEGIKSIFSGIWNAIKDIISGKWEKIKSLVQNGITFVSAVITAAWNAIESLTSWIWESIKSIFSGTCDALKNLADSGFSGIKNIILGVWNEIRETTSKVWDEVETTVSNIWNNLKTSVSTIFNNIKTDIVNAWNSIKSETASSWNGISSKISDSIKGVKTVISDIMNRIKEIWDKIWDGMLGKINSVLDNIKNAVSSAFGWIMGIIEKASSALSGLFSGASSANEASASSGEASPTAYSAKMTSFSNIPMPTIPALASGAVIRGGNPFIAELGDQPRWQTNIETPLPTMLKAMKQAIAESGGMGGGEYTFIAQLEGKTIFEETVRQNDMYINRTGRSRFTY